MAKQELNCTHTITIELKTSLDLMNHPVMKQLMADMAVQIESLSDGTYDDVEGISTTDLDVNAVLGNTRIYSVDTTSYFDETTRLKILSETENRYCDSGMDIDELSDMSDTELLDIYEQMVDQEDELLIDAQAQIAVHTMLKSETK